MVNFTSSLTEVFNSMGNMSYISDILDSMNFNSLYETLEAFVNGYKWDDVLLANMQRYLFINPFLTNGFSHHYHLGESTFTLGAPGVIF